ncbi:Stress responsive A/B Barrel Domain protein [Rubripirellula lacrimiformis]|uniref:Stress responsive A/B Barrel Domain protein n=1 Tax=Rubripirellula lacrimiformis TaxID=1930273 RepID=A0A517NHJ3_9BACT|nr:Dabb family protein [Rubripirellula lacrimiformis]QDT06548.1 Stress responsive A/B Barrel Domain protein [Rubripirellula lacrimiformis]
MKRLYRNLLCLSATLMAASMVGGADAEADDHAAKSGKVLRHAVFFAFKDSSSAEDVQGVVDAFEALPSKIDSIQGFQWGTDNSPEGLADGFTHAFVLSFADEAGRAKYLPHPEHAAFGGVLRPHMKEVFVVDYWGDDSKDDLEKQLKHAVFFKFKDDAAAQDIQTVEEAFAALPAKIDSIKAFEWGVNNSPEKHDDGFTHCFMVTFDSEAGREKYLPHADHLAFVEVLKPVLDKVRVIDFWAK